MRKEQTKKHSHVRKLQFNNLIKFNYALHESNLLLSNIRTIFVLSNDVNLVELTLMLQHFACRQYTITVHFLANRPDRIAEKKVDNQLGEVFDPKMLLLLTITDDMTQLGQLK